MQLDITLDNVAPMSYWSLYMNSLSDSSLYKEQALQLATLFMTQAEQYIEKGLVTENMGRCYYTRFNGTNRIRAMVIICRLGGSNADQYEDKLKALAAASQVPYITNWQKEVL